MEIDRNKILQFPGIEPGSQNGNRHDDVIKWKHFPRYWPFVRGIHRSPVNSPHKGQWRGALMFSLICVWINAWVNNREAGDLRRRRAHYDVIVIIAWYHYTSSGNKYIADVFYQSIPTVIHTYKLKEKMLVDNQCSVVKIYDMPTLLTQIEVNSERKKSQWQNCTARESNPGCKNGNFAWCHCTIIAYRNKW